MFVCVWTQHQDCHVTAWKCTVRTTLYSRASASRLFGGPLFFLDSEYQKIADRATNVVENAVQETPSNRTPPPQLLNPQTSPPSIPQQHAVKTDDEFLPPSSPSTLEDAEHFVFECHDQRWNSTAVDDWVNGDVKPISCRVRGPEGYFMQEGSAPGNMKLLDYFFGCFHFHIWQGWSFSPTKN